MIEQCAPGTRFAREVEKLPEPPTLLPGLQPFYRAFWALNDSRSYGMSEGTIPWSEVELYGRAHGFDEEQLEDLHHYIPALDSVYRSTLAKQREKKRPHADKAQPGKLRAQNPANSKGRGARRG